MCSVILLFGGGGGDVLFFMSGSMLNTPHNRLEITVPDGWALNTNN